ncbi:AAA family ATPase [Butyrivibrio sp. MC2013]|uniref:AAA family ATPase n=1 Tax=Butyrivibrio sp. MC2013 TaxID=1280686 RepID=UPI00041FF5A6|nr:ATP-binding protein [Butyrivibrio sp. MC2013]
MIGRKKEIAELNRLYDSKKAELLAIYGRRRVGKTYLVDETFEGRITFRHAGLSPTETAKGALRLQLRNFYNSLLDQGMPESKAPDNWLDAFFILEQFLKSKDTGERQLVFLDELPWLDTPRSGFITAFEAFWNNWACHRKNLMVIVCGSANSWILDKLINNHGGLYNRVTYEIKLSPFSLSECEEYYSEQGVSFSRYDIAQSYMILGGVPFYLGYMQRNKSLAQNIDDLFFSKGAKLSDEYDRLFASAFSNPEAMKEIVAVLSGRNMGYCREELVARLRHSDGGTLSKHLKALIASDFIISYYPFGEGKRKEYFRLTDSFCLFYLHFKSKINSKPELYWEKNVSGHEISSWRGFAFERLCFNHIPQIKKALGISGVITSESAWSKKADDEDGVQIDLLILRNDNVVNMCEIKYYSDDYTVDKDYYRTMLRRTEILSGMVPKKCAVYGTLITTFGLKHNEYSGVFNNLVTLDDLFEA